MFFESSLEKKIQLYAFSRPGTAEVKEQQRVDYIDFSGRSTQHYFDLLLETTNGESIAIAIKPSAIAEKSDVRSLLELIASQTPKAVADRVVLVTERNITRDLVYNAELIHSVRLDPEPDSDDVVRSHVGELHGSLRIAELTKRCGIGGSAFRSVVRLIASGDIHLPDRRARITPESLICLPALGEARS